MKKNYVRILIMSVIFMIGLNSQAISEMKPGAVSIYPFVGGYLFEGNQDWDEDAIVGGSLGYHITKCLSVEAGYRGGYFNYEFDDIDLSIEHEDFDIQMVYLDGLYHFNTLHDKIIPYIVGGFGVMQNHDDKFINDEESAFFHYGVGVNYFVTDHIAIRMDVRHVLNYNNDGENDLYNNLTGSVGINFVFGGKTKKCESYSYEEPIQETIESSPIKSEPIVKFKKAKINKPISMPDSDGDGIFDDKDQCPDTPSGVEVNIFGCWVINLRFLPNEYKILDYNSKSLDKIIAVMKNNPDLKIEIQGHTDKQGSADYNKKLSQKRAESVLGYLYHQGINMNRLKAKGYGFDVPLATNDTPEGRAINRRVQIQPFK